MIISWGRFLVNAAPCFKIVVTMEEVYEDFLTHLLLTVRNLLLKASMPEDSDPRRTLELLLTWGGKEQKSEFHNDDDLHQHVI